MGEIFKKEIATFFSSAIGYLVVGVFLVATWLILWVFPSDLNILYGGYATLSPLFDIAPWIYLFLVPAIAMRMLAEERRQGTLDLLLLRPLPLWKVVVAKFLSGLTLVVASILPTAIYALLVAALGSPVGNLDVGATLGSYLALLLLAATYMSIGLAASSLTDNQIVAFVAAAALCAATYVGFDMLASLQPQATWAALVTECGIAEHYASLSRGVVDSRDVVYFLSVCLLMLTLTALQLKRRIRTRLAVGVVASLLALNALSVPCHVRLDLTQEGRYTLQEVTRRTAASQAGPVSLRLYLGGDLNAGFRRLRRATEELADEVGRLAPQPMTLRRIDPGALSANDLKELQDDLAKSRLAAVPVYETKEDGQKTRTMVYPYLRLDQGGRHLYVDLLDRVAGLTAEEALNRSMEDTEYKLTDALTRLSVDSAPRVAFLEGHGELDDLDCLSLTEALSQHFSVDRGRIGRDPAALDPYKVVIVAKPTQAVPEKDKWVLDQYMMRGGRVLWLIDAVSMTLDSLRDRRETIGLVNETNLDDQLFTYGVRVRPAVVEDMSCGMIAVSVSGADGQSQLVPMPWLFGPLLSTNVQSAISRNVSCVHADFCSPLDTVGALPGVRRTPLLRTSAMTASHQAPLMADLVSIHRQRRQEEFRERHLTVALLQEGVFRSAYRRRPRPEGLLQPAFEPRDTSLATRMIVVGDGDVARNDVRMRHTPNPTIVPLGYDELSRQTYGNQDFLLNAVLYLADDQGLMELRNRSFALRLLDRAKIAAGTNAYKATALVLPLLLIGIIGLAIVCGRKRAFAGKRK